MVEKIKTDVEGITFDFENEIKFPLYFDKIELFFNFKIKSSLSTSIFIFFTIFQILEKKFYVF